MIGVANEQDYKDTTAVCEKDRQLFARDIERTVSEIYTKNWQTMRQSKQQYYNSAAFEPPIGLRQAAWCIAANTTGDILNQKPTHFGLDVGTKDGKIAASDLSFELFMWGEWWEKYFAVLDHRAREKSEASRPDWLKESKRENIAVQGMGANIKTLSKNSCRKFYKELNREGIQAGSNLTAINTFVR